MESGSEFTGLEFGREQRGAIGHRSEIAKHPTIGEAHRHRRGEPGRGEVVGHRPVERVPERGVDAADAGRVVHDRFHPHLRGQITERFGKMRLHLGLRLAGKCANVHFEHHRIGDHVGLHFGSGVDRIGRKRGVGAGVQKRCGSHIGETGQQVVELVLVEQKGRGLRVEPECIDLLAPEFVESGRRVVVGDPLDHGRRFHQRVVLPKRHRAVAGHAVHSQPPPCHALLSDRHRNRRRFGSATVEPTVLGEHVIGPDGIGVVVGHPSGTVGASGFLVGYREIDQVTLRPKSRRGEVAECHSHRRRDVEHVDRSPAPHLAVHQLAVEWVTIPAVGVHRHHVGMSHQAQARSGGVGSVYAAHQRYSARSRLESLHSHSGALDHRLQRVGVADLLARFRGPVVHTGISDQSLEKFHRLAGEPLRFDVIRAGAIGPGTCRHEPSMSLARDVMSVRHLQGCVHETCRIEDCRQDRAEVNRVEVEMAEVNRVEVEMADTKRAEMDGVEMNRAESREQA